MDYDDKGALNLINQALSHNNQHSNNWNKKAIILEGLQRFDESKECYDKSLSLNRQQLVIENKSRMLKSWAAILFRNIKDLPKAINLLNEAIHELSSLPSTEEDINSYKRLVKDIEDKINMIEKSKQSKEYSNLKNSLSNDVIRNLTKEGHTLESQIYSLIKFINDVEKKRKCIFNKIYYSNKAIRGNVGFTNHTSVSGIVVEFTKNRLYLNSTITIQYYQSQDHMDYDQEYIEIIDESHIFNNPEISKLKQVMENNGYEYSEMDIIGKGKRISIKFRKDELLNRTFEFSFKNNEITSSSEYIDVYVCYHSTKSTPERKIIQQEVKRIENEYNCSLTRIEFPATIHFSRHDGTDLTLGYNYKTKKIEKTVIIDKTLEKYPKEELIVINATYYDCIKEFKKGMEFKLVKESRDKEAYNAIAVYLDKNKIGYVTNTFQHPYGTSTANDINISDNSYAEYLLHYYQSGKLYHVARIIEKEETNQVEHLHQFATMHLRKSEFEHAIVYLNELIAIEPSNISFLQTAGYCYHELKQYDKALECFTKILELDSNNYNALFFKAKILTELEKYEESMEYLNKLIKIKPNDSDNWFYKASNLVALEQYEEADTCFNKAIELNPNLINVWYQKALNLITLKQYDKANSCLDKAIELNPSLDTLWYTKGKLLTELNKYEESIEYLDKAIELNQKYILAHNTKGIALTELGKYDDAIECFDEVLFLDPTNSQALQLMGYLCLVGLKDYNQAIKYIKVAIKINPNDSMNWNNLGDAYLNIADYEKALECCDKARSLDSNNFRAWFTTGEIYYELKQYDKAMEYATKAKEINSTDDDLLKFIDKLDEILPGGSEVMIDPIRNPIGQKEFNELQTSYNVLNRNYIKLKSLIIDGAENNQSAEEILKKAEEKKLI